MKTTFTHCLNQRHEKALRNALRLENLLTIYTLLIVSYLINIEKRKLKQNKTI